MIVNLSVTDGPAPLILPQPWAPPTLALPRPRGWSWDRLSRVYLRESSPEPEVFDRDDLCFWEEVGIPRWLAEERL